ncbi:hypothetical protein [Levilactobacillus brevis]|nr:hypothetical protein [Levilactobacillus brevis]
MGIGRFIMGTTLAAGAGLAAYLVATQQDPRTWGNALNIRSAKPAIK